MMDRQNFLEQLGAKITFKRPRNAETEGAEMEFIGSDRLRRRIDDLCLGARQPARSVFRH